ncbi:MAG TPA: ABC transporter ATP-binding protein, partial [Bryobacteraceae bacterium]|nr:ABC transporter ATP-binding protein [Bryobacteraceae bacterium]
MSKLYKLYGRPSDRLLELLPVAGSRRYSEFWALRNVSLQVQAGEILGLVGPNGSGKSTLLQIASGILKPSSGRVSVEGRIAALLELGAGFNPEFTGRENVYLSGEIMGFGRREVDRLFPEIRDFAEIGEFMERPVKEYSSGMYIRLAFATAIHAQPEILIVDEALAVGDAIFANRCLRRLEQLKRDKTTILFVSHDLGIVKRLCDRAVLMLRGEIAAEGLPHDVINRYIGLVHDNNALENQPGAISSSFRHGDRTTVIDSVRLLDERESTTCLVRSGEYVTVEMTATAQKPVPECIAGILVRSRLGIEVFGTNSRIENTPLGPFEAGEQFVVRFSFPCHLTRGDYTLTVATQHADGTSQDWLDDALQMTILDDKNVAGV